MTLTLNGTNYVAEGPYGSENDLKEQSGVYIITTKDMNGNHNVIDIGESENIKDRVSNHDRGSCWSRNKNSGLFASVIYCNEQKRMQIESELRNTYTPVCGIR